MPTNPAPKPLKRGEIELLCEHCGNRTLAPRAEYDPDRAALIVTSECNRCHAAMGGFSDFAYYDICGHEVSHEG